MQGESKNTQAAKKRHRLVTLFVVFSLLITLPFTTMPSSGKYVLDPIIDTTSLHSSETYTVLSLGEIAGTAQVGQTLTAGTLSPIGATVDYQWQRASEADGVYAEIPGATSGTYTLAGEDEGYYIRVSATGKDSFTGTVSSPYTGPVAACPVTDIGGISGAAQIGQTLAAGSLTPAGATVDFQWQRAFEADGSYTDIPGATANTYLLTAGDKDYYIRVTATGRDGYTGTATSAYAGPVTAIPITAIGATGGTAQIGQTLSAGTIVPAGATGNYQWQKAPEAGGAYADIPGATASTYTLSADDTGSYLIVRATGTGSYTGTVSSAYKGPVAAGLITAIGPISGTAAIGEILTAGTLTPFGATVAYQWQRSSVSGPFTNINGATSNTYTLTGSDSNRYIRVVATGIGAYTGEVISEYVGLVGATIIPLTSFGEISGAAEVGQVLTAGILNPVGATATY
ncbi:MAG: hypothetical protein PHC91_04680, partial [Eubacteriales bacterium]|nr:hypothetical protein [Eubacteriales bacterium]